MTDPSNPDLRLLAALGELAVAAGRRIVSAGAEGFVVCQKADGSPVTVADVLSETLLLAGLAELLPEVPAVSEEACDAGAAPPLGERALLVDPLDGTKSFLAGSEEYTVNLALIEHGTPLLGVVHAPRLGMSWLGAVGHGAWRAATIGDRLAAPSAWQPIRARPRPPVPVVVVSRHYFDAATAARVADYGPTDCRHLGAALKFALLADGRADLYPRASDVREWDVAAGDAVLAAAGGVVRTLDGAPLTYGHAERGFRVHGFEAAGDPRPVRS